MYLFNNNNFIWSYKEDSSSTIKLCLSECINTCLSLSSPLFLYLTFIFRHVANPEKVDLLYRTWVQSPSSAVYSNDMTSATVTVELLTCSCPLVQQSLRHRIQQLFSGASASPVCWTCASTIKTHIRQVDKYREVSSWASCWCNVISCLGCTYLIYSIRGEVLQYPSFSPKNPPKNEKNKTQQKTTGADLYLSSLKDCEIPWFKNVSMSC